MVDSRDFATNLSRHSNLTASTGEVRTPRTRPDLDTHSSPMKPPKAAGAAAAKPFEPPRALVESLDHEAHGVAHAGGKVVFIEDALPGETVEYSTFKRKPSFDVARATRILAPSFMRVDPRCTHFGICGGCNMQHLEASAQVAVKQRVLEDNLERIGKVEPEELLPALHGPAWGYRHRARLTVRLVAKKGGVLVGFHERRSSYVADMSNCSVLPPAVAKLLPELRVLVGGMSIANRLPQIEVAVGERVTVLVLRVLDPIDVGDAARLREFADRHGIQFWLQPGGPATAEPYYPLDAPELAYDLPEFGLIMPFRPTEFTQVNAAVNRSLVGRAVRLLAPMPGERIADLFCGLGNFGLAVARSGATVVGLEGSDELVARARANAERNGLASRCSFARADLFTPDAPQLTALGRFDGMVIDPPRDGALEVVKALGAAPPSRIVYVSCSPATLARDAGVLVNVHGYRLRCAGVVNMFPHTAHVESIALFEYAGRSGPDAAGAMPAPCP
jgi:23S rRNA (uracil1939-C5)-methyltransferase